MNAVSFFAFVLVAICGMVTAKNNYFVKSYRVPGSNCTKASNKVQETFQMNICLDTMTMYTDGKTNFVDESTYSDYKCSTKKSTKSYELQTCAKYDSSNDIYPSAY